MLFIHENIILRNVIYYLATNTFVYNPSKNKNVILFRRKLKETSIKNEEAGILYSRRLLYVWSCFYHFNS